MRTTLEKREIDQITNYFFAQQLAIDDEDRREGGSEQFFSITRSVGKRSYFDFIEVIWAPATCCRLALGFSLVKDANCSESHIIRCGNHRPRRRLGDVRLNRPSSLR
jgi:hypothetical protein